MKRQSKDGSKTAEVKTSMEFDHNNFLIQKKVSEFTYRLVHRTFRGDPAKKKHALFHISLWPPNNILRKQTEHKLNGSEPA